MRTFALLLSTAAVLAASGCTRSQSAVPERLELSCFAGAPAAPGPVYIGLAPGRMPASLAPAPWETSGEPALVGGMFWDPWGPFPDDASIVVNGIAVAGGWIFYVPGFAVGAVASVLVFPFLGISTFLWLPDSVGEIFGMAGYYVLAVPLYAVQKVCWDAPCALVRFIRLHSKSCKGQVEWLIPRHEDSPYGKQVQRKLKKLTGEDFGSREAWDKWWSAHRDEFDKDMKRIKPAAPAAPAPAAPTPAVQGA